MKQDYDICLGVFIDVVWWTKSISRWLLKYTAWCMVPFMKVLFKLVLLLLLTWSDTFILFYFCPSLTKSAPAHTHTYSPRTHPHTASTVFTAHSDGPLSLKITSWSIWVFEKSLRASSLKFVIWTNFIWTNFPITGKLSAPTKFLRWNLKSFRFILIISWVW